MKNFYQTGDNLTFLASQIVAPQHTLGDTYTNLVGPGEGATTPVNLVEDSDPVVIGRIVGVAAGNRNLAAGIGYYEAALSFYENFLHRGHDVVFPRNTRIEIETNPLRAPVLTPSSQ